MGGPENQTAGLPSIKTAHKQSREADLNPSSSREPAVPHRKGLVVEVLHRTHNDIELMTRKLELAKKRLHKLTNDLRNAHNERDAKMKLGSKKPTDDDSDQDSIYEVQILFLRTYLKFRIKFLRRNSRNVLNNLRSFTIVASF